METVDPYLVKEMTDNLYHGERCLPPGIANSSLVFYICRWHGCLEWGEGNYHRVGERNVESENRAGISSINAGTCTPNAFLHAFISQ